MLPTDLLIESRVEVQRNIAVLAREFDREAAIINYHLSAINY